MNEKKTKEEKLAEKEERKAQKEENAVAKAKADAEHWKNEYYRAYADMQNLRKLVEKDHKEAMKYRTEGFIGDLIPILDSFHFALKVEPSSEEMKNFLIGFQFIYRNLVSVLENEGVSEIEPVVGKKYDPTIMQALETKESDGEENIILEVKTKGYKLHDHLVRPAIVVVSKKPKLEEAPTEEVDA